MELFIASFLAGLLTILAPCTLTLLPIILTGGAAEKKYAPLIVAISLGITVFFFTLLLKGTVLLIDIPFSVLQGISGVLILILGISITFPTLWTNIETFLHLDRSQTLIAKAKAQEGNKVYILLGMALGPVFTTCSPTYLFILGTILPTSFSLGTLYLFAYILGLIVMLLTVGYGGRSLLSKLKFAANPEGWFKRSIGTLLILLGVAIATGFDKVVEQSILEFGYNGPIQIEDSILEYLGQK